MPDKSAYKDRNWLKCYKAFKQFISEYHTVPEYKDEYNGAAIGYWYFKVVKAYHKGELSPKRTEMLLSLGVEL